MTKRYRSKVAPVLAVPLGLVLFAVEALMVLHGIMIAAAFVLAVILTIVYLYFSTVYEITESGVLKVKSGLGVHTQIPVNRISQIKPSHSLLAAPSWSNDRLEIVYQPGLSILVSPVRKEMFIRELLHLQPNIIVADTESTQHVY